MRLCQNKFFGKTFICFIALASTLTTCYASEVETEEKKSASTTPTKFNKKAGFVFVGLVSIIVGGVIYKYRFSQSEQTQSSLGRDSILLDEQNKDEESKPPIDNAAPRRPNTLQEAIDNESSDSSSNNNDDYSDEEKESEVNLPYKNPPVPQHIQNNQRDNHMSEPHIPRGAPQQQNNSLKVNQSYTDSSVQEYLLSNLEDGQISATEILRNGDIQKNNNTNVVEDNDTINNIDLDEQRRLIQHYNNQKNNNSYSSQLDLHKLEEQEKAWEMFEEAKKLKGEQRVQKCPICMDGFNENDTSPEYKNNPESRIPIKAKCCMMFIHGNCLNNMIHYGQVKCPQCQTKDFI